MATWSGFFYQNLIDADPASNTLSWRWVAGLQTQGKKYITYKENIDRFTDGRLVFQIILCFLIE